MREVMIPRQAGQMERIELDAEERAKLVREVRRRSSLTVQVDVLSERVLRMERALWGLGIFVVVMAIGLLLVADELLRVVNSGR
jgi:hypothetical protein